MKSQTRFLAVFLVLCLASLASLLDLACSPRQADERPAAFDVSPVEQSTTAGALPGAVFAPAPQDQTSTIRFERIAAEDGLSQNAVLAIWQDHRGFMWFGTEGGLNKYDGYQFIVYRHDPDDPLTLSDDFVSSIYEDRNGNLWVGTRNGLNRFDRATGTFTRYQHDPDNPQSLGGTWVVAIYGDHEGTLWVGIEDGGLDQLDRNTGTFTHYRHDADNPNTLSDDTVRAIHEDSSGYMWIATHSGLNRFDRAAGTFIHYQHDPDDPQSLSGDQVSAIFEDHQGALWIGTEDGGLNQFDRSSETFIRYQHDPDDPRSLSHDRVRAILEDSTGRLWVGTQNGLNMLPPAQADERDQFIRYRHSASDLHSLSTNPIWSIYEDRTGILWFGTYGGGLSKYNRTTSQFALYQHNPDVPNSLSENMIWSICEDRSGNLWIGTFNGGLNKLDRDSGTFTAHRHDPEDPASLGSDDVRALLEDRQGILWVGTNGGGLAQFVPRTGTFVHYRHDPDDPNSLSEDRVTVLYEDKAGNLWVGTRDGGVNRLDRATETFTRYQHDPDDGSSLSDDRVWSLYEDRSGALWVGTLGGINVLDVATGQFVRYLHDPDDPQSLSNDQVFSLYEDPADAVWIGTWGSGLDRFDPATQTFAHYTERDGLPDNVIYGIEVDSQGFLWLSTNRGLSKFDPRAETFQNYDVRNGLQNNEFNVGAHFTSESGEMFFGGIEGFNAFYPERVTGNPHVPPIVVTSFSKLNEVVRRDLSPNEHIQLSYKDNFISFEFAALDYTAPDKNEYAYMLEGQNQDWVYARTHRHVDYTNLRGGDYVFRVKGSNNDGVWNEEGVAITVTVTPPVWETWWFRGIVLLVLVGGAISGYRLRVRSIEARRRELERQVKERTAELSRTNALLQQEIAERERMEEALARQAAGAAVAAERSRLARELHDAVSQTLFSASLIAEVLPRLWERNQDEGRRRLEEIRQLTRGALAEMRTLLLELRPSALIEAELGDLLRQLAESITGRARVPVRLEVQGEPSCSLPSDLKVAMYRIAQESLNNVAKHAEASQATISLRCEAERVELQISDDGRGFDLENVPVESLGLGIMRERAEAIGAEMTIESEVGRGTVVTVVWITDE
jgi:signal transduction histidine kinase/ligand-binding sensor domain-containing protein